MNLPDMTPPPAPDHVTAYLRTMQGLLGAASAAAGVNSMETMKDIIVLMRNATTECSRAHLYGDQR